MLPRTGTRPVESKWLSTQVKPWLMAGSAHPTSQSARIATLGVQYRSRNHRLTGTARYPPGCGGTRQSVLDPLPHTSKRSPRTDLAAERLKSGSCRNVIHPTAVLAAEVIVDPTTDVGAYAVIGMPVPPGRFGSPSRLPGARESKPKPVHLGPGVVVGPHAVIDDGSIIEGGVWIGAGVRLGHDVLVQEDAEIYYRAQIYDRAVVGPRAMVGGFLCNDANVGSDSVVMGSLVHRFTDAVVGVPEDPPRVERNAFVGWGATVIGPVTVGERAYLAAGATLTRDASPGRLYMGTPARDCGPAPSPFAG